MTTIGDAEFKAWLDDSQPLFETFLQEHARREGLPRSVCPTCQFEFSEEDRPHICREEGPK